MLSRHVNAPAILIVRGGYVMKLIIYTQPFDQVKFSMFWNMRLISGEDSRLASDDLGVALLVCNWRVTCSRGILIASSPVRSATESTWTVLERHNIVMCTVMFINVKFVILVMADGLRVVRNWGRISSLSCHGGAKVQVSLIRSELFSYWRNKKQSLWSGNCLLRRTSSSSLLRYFTAKLTMRNNLRIML